MDLTSAIISIVSVTKNVFTSKYLTRVCFCELIFTSGERGKAR
jgi:hypothetical protein